MCSYCGCEAEAVIAELMADHAQLANLAHLARQALVDGDLGIANEQCARIARLFAVHGKKEEEGLFAELRLDPIATEAVEELEAEHRRLDSALSTGPSDLGAAGFADILDLLAAHAEREDTDVFPVALQVLPNEAWDRMAKAQESLAGQAIS